jgi:hypothetical protein
VSSDDSDHQTALNAVVRPSGAGPGGDAFAAFYRPAADAATAYSDWQCPVGYRGGRPARHWTWQKALGVACGTLAVLILLHAGAHFYEHHSTHIPATMVADLSSTGCG